MDIINSIIAVGGTILGALIGGCIAYKLQARSDRQRERLNNLDFARSKKLEIYYELLKQLQIGNLYPLIVAHERKLKKITAKELFEIIEPMSKYIKDNYYKFALISSDEISYQLGKLAGYCDALMRRIKTNEAVDVKVTLDKLNSEIKAIEQLMRMEFEL